MLLALTTFCGCTQNEQRVSLDSPEFGEVVKTLESGTWIWHEGNCNENRQSFEFDLKNKTVTLSLAKPIGIDGDVSSNYTYKILWAWNGGFRGQIIGEKRLDDNGNPVEWDLILTKNNSFYWRRNDWTKASGTNRNSKCP